MQPALFRHGGFSLVELVAVMVVMGILAIGTVRFIADSSTGFATTISRTELAGDARYAIERLTRELRAALPESIRVAGGCIEFIPVAAASSYTTLPIASSASSFTAVPIEPMPLPAGVRAAVYPDSATYQLSGVSAISPPVVVSAPDGNNEVTVTMSAPHRFPVESPSNRFFLISDPVSFCVVGERLWRYQGYGFLSAQPGVGGLPSGLPNRALLAERVATATPFTVSAATLVRNAVVEIDMDFVRGDDRVSLQHLVQVRNVP